MRIIPSKDPIIVGEKRNVVTGGIGVDRSRRVKPCVVLTITDETGQKFDIIAEPDNAITIGLACISIATSIQNGGTIPPAVELKLPGSLAMVPPPKD